MHVLCFSTVGLLLSSPCRISPVDILQVKIPKRRRVVHPPPELILLPPGVSRKKTLLAVEEAFRSTYRMFSDFQVRPHPIPRPCPILR